MPHFEQRRQVLVSLREITRSGFEGKLPQTGQGIIVFDDDVTKIGSYTFGSDNPEEFDLIYLDKGEYKEVSGAYCISYTYDTSFFITLHSWWKHDEGGSAFNHETSGRILSFRF